MYLSMVYSEKSGPLFPEKANASHHDGQMRTESIVLHYNHVTPILNDSHRIERKRRRRRKINIHIKATSFLDPCSVITLANTQNFFLALANTHCRKSIYATLVLIWMQGRFDQWMVLLMMTMIMTTIVHFTASKLDCEFLFLTLRLFESI